MPLWLTTPVFILCAAIILLLGVRAFFVVRSERDQKQRGSPPGQGDHIVKAEYFSGGAGGGHQSEFRVPKDPQAYARKFVPGSAKSKE